jgi:hypothetical protein
MVITRRQLMLGGAVGAAGCGRRRGEPAADSITVLYQYDETVLAYAQPQRGQRDCELCFLDGETVRSYRTLAGGRT